MKPYKSSFFAVFIACSILSVSACQKHEDSSPSVESSSSSAEPSKGRIVRDDPKSSYGQAVKKAYDVDDRLGERDDEVADQADALFDE